MKYSFTLLLLLLTFNFVSCKKDQNTPSSAPLMGTWELRRGSVGIGMSMDYPPGNGGLLKFSSGDKYEKYDAGQLVESGTFHLTSEVAAYNNQRVNLIRLGDSETRNTYVIVNDTLSLSSYPYDDNGNLIADGGGADYVRITE